MNRIFNYISLCILAGVLSSYAASIVSGTVSDSLSAAPVNSAIVALRAPTNPTVLRDTTGATGQFSIGNVVIPGNYTVTITAPGYATKQTTLTVDTSNHGITANFNLLKIDTAVVSGTITDSTNGDQLKGAIVSLRQANSVTVIATDTTLADGQYSFAKVISGEIIVVTDSSYTAKRVTMTVNAATPITENIAIVPIQYGKVTGTVTDSLAATPVDQAIVTLRSAAGATLETDTTGTDGKYTFVGVQGATYSVRVSAAAYTTKTVTGVVVAGTATVTLDISIVKIQYATLAGIVTDSLTTDPVADAVVTLESNTGAAIKTMTTGSSGAYTFDSVPDAATSYRINVTQKVYVPKTVTVMATGTATITTNIPITQAVFTTVSGTVSDSATGDSLSGAVVTLLNGTATVEKVTTGANGSYTLDSVKVGNYTITVTDSSYITRTGIAVHVIDATPVTVAVVKLVKGSYGAITGTVADSVTKTLLKGAIVTIRTGTTGIGQVIATDTTDVNGMFNFTNITVGVYTIRVTATNYITKNVVDSVKDQQTGTVDVVLSKSGITFVSNTVTLNNSVKEISISSQGIIHLSNFSNAGKIALYGIDGKLLYQHSFNQSTTSLTLPSQVISRGNSYVVRVSQNNTVYNKNVIIP